MNWYKFKIELAAWAAKVVLAVGTTLVVGRTFFEPVDSIRLYSLEMRTVAENEWIFPVVLTISILILWALYWKIFHMYRSQKAYG